MEPVRTGLRQLISDLLRARPAEEAVLMGWPLVCGKEVAARSQALAFSEGKLTVEVPDTTWRGQLQSFAPRYLSEYGGLLGPVVRNVEFRIKHSAISNPHTPPKRAAGTTSTSATARKGITSGKPKRNAG
jgi:Dna[CI] antecedent DciA-like protein